MSDRRERRDWGGRAGSRPSRNRAARVAVESLEGRALLSVGGVINDIATLPGSLTAGPMVVGPNSVVYFAENGRAGGPALGKLSATGQRDEIPLPAAGPGDRVTAVAADGAGNVWFALAVADGAPAAGKVGKLAPDGSIHEFPLPNPGETPGAAAVGADGSLNVAVSGGAGGPAIARVKADGSVDESPLKGASGPATWLTRGSDGNLWFVDGAKVGKMTPAGVVSEYPMPAPADGKAVDLGNAQLTNGPDGNLWFIGLGGLSKITPEGTVTTIAVPNTEITAITAAPGNTLYFAAIPPAGSPLASTPGEVIGRISADNVYTPLPDHTDVPGAVVRMVQGPDASVWLNQGGTTLSRINAASIPSVTPVMITPTTPHAVSTNARKTVAGPIVSFKANYPGALPTDFTATVNYGDGYTGKGAVVTDPNGGFDVLGYNTYKVPFGQQMKVTVTVSAANGVSDQIFGVVNVTNPRLAAAAARASAHAAAAKPHPTAKAAVARPVVTRPGK